MLENTVQKLLENDRTIMYYFNNADRMTILGYDNDPEVLNESIYRFISILRHELQDICPVITTVISSDIRRLGEISEAYRTVYGLSKTASGIAAGQVINVSDTAQVAANMLQQDTPFGEEFRQKLQFADPRDAEKILDEVFLSASGGQFDSTLMRYNALIALVKITVQMIRRADPGADEKDIAVQLSSQLDILKAAENKNSFRTAAARLIDQALNARQGNSGEIKYHHVISQAEQYVKENFCDPNISLISVANHVSMSAAYFSTVFSQTVGRSFITYLTALRIEKAKVLLKTTGMKLTDIALEIGYNEPNYFSHVFRKTVGMTPKEYRMKNA